MKFLKIWYGFLFFYRFKEEFDSIERIGKGAFGRVFKAKNCCDEKFYAVKIVKVKDKE